MTCPRIRGQVIAKCSDNRSWHQC